MAKSFTTTVVFQEGGKNIQRRMNTTKRVRRFKSSTIKARNVLSVCAEICVIIPNALLLAKIFFCGPYMCAGQKKNGKTAERLNTQNKRSCVVRTPCMSTLFVTVTPSVELLTFLVEWYIKNCRSSMRVLWS